MDNIKHRSETYKRFTPIDDHHNEQGDAVDGSQSSASLAYRLFPRDEHDQKDIMKDRSAREKVLSTIPELQRKTKDPRENKTRLLAPLQSSETDELTAFESSLLFGLTFKYINYPASAVNISKPLHYLPIPLEILPGVQPIHPAKCTLSFSRISDIDMFIFTIDSILVKAGYHAVSHRDVWKVYISYTHQNGKRTRLAVSLNNVALLTKPWARDVYLGHLPQFASNCTCDDCGGGKHAGLRQHYGHGIEIEVVFPQGTENKHTSKIRLGGHLKRSASPDEEYWGKKAKKAPVPPLEDNRGRSMMPPPRSVLRRRDRVSPRKSDDQKFPQRVFGAASSGSRLENGRNREAGPPERRRVRFER